MRSASTRTGAPPSVELSSAVAGLSGLRKSFDASKLPGAGLAGLAFDAVAKTADNFFTTAGLLNFSHQYVSQRMLAEEFLIVDIFLGNKNAVQELIALTREKGGLCELRTPLWVCPVRRAARKQPFSPHHLPPVDDEEDHSDSPVLLDLGLYGRVANHKGVEAARFVERFCEQKGGRKMLYSQNFFSQQEFWRVYDREEYQRLRRKYGGDGGDHAVGAGEKGAGRASEEDGTGLVDLYTKVGPKQERETGPWWRSYGFWHGVAKLT